MRLLGAIFSQLSLFVCQQKDSNPRAGDDELGALSQCYLFWLIFEQLILSDKIIVQQT